jgi:hypothetical protein
MGPCSQGGSQTTPTQSTPDWQVVGWELAYDTKSCTGFCRSEIDVDMVSWQLYERDYDSKDMVYHDAAGELTPLGHTQFIWEVNEVDNATLGGIGGLDDEYGCPTTSTYKIVHFYDVANQVPKTVKYRSSPSPSCVQSAPSSELVELNNYLEYWIHPALFGEWSSNHVVVF